MVQLELLSKENEEKVLAIDRDDIPECFAESMSYTIQLSHYGIQQGLKGFCFAIKYFENYVGLILVGEAIEDEADPVEVKNRSYFRVIGFVLDRSYRDRGIGSQAFTLALEKIYHEYGTVPILLECHRKNQAAIRFYEKMGFINTNRLHNDDYYMVKLPAF